MVLKSIYAATLLLAGRRFLTSFICTYPFGASFKDNVIQTLAGPKLKKQANLIWANAVKALLARIRFKRNQRVFQEKSLSWINRFEAGRLDSSTCCSLSKSFSSFLVQDICLNWTAFTSLAQMLLISLMY